MSYILDALKQQSDNQQISPTPGVVTLGGHSGSLGREMLGLTVQLLMFAGLGLAVGYGTSQWFAPSITAPQTIVSNPEDQPIAALKNPWPLMQTDVEQDFFDQPFSALPTDQVTHSSEQVNQQSAEPELSVEQVPQALKDQFAAALEAVNQSSNSADTNQQPAENFSQQVPHLSELPQGIQNAIPALKFTSHMYSSDKADRWIEVNKKRLVEGQWVASNVQVIAIRPQHVILQTDGYRYSLPALSEW